MAVGTVAVCAFLGRRLYGPLGGLLAALGLAVMPLAVRFAHLANTDTPMVLWIGLVTLWGVRIVQDRRLADCFWAGVFVGLAGATKYPGALVALPVGLACWLRVSSLRDKGIWLAGGASVLTFALASPYVVLDASTAMEALGKMGEDHVLTEKHSSGTSWEHVLRVNLRYGLGLVGLVMLIPGLFWHPFQRRREEWVVVAGLIVFLLLLAVARSDFMRYALPLAPLVAVLWVRPLLVFDGRRWLLILACVVLMIEPLYASWRTRSLLSGGDTRQQVKDRLEEQVEGGCYIFQPMPGPEIIEGISPKRFFSRQVNFLQSYGADDLQVAYEWLSHQEGLPLLLLNCGYELGFQRLSKEGEEPGSMGWLVWLDHPLLAGEEESVELQQLMERSSAVAEFSPGQANRAIFDPVDWIFLPVGGFGAVERSGPTIRLGRVPLYSSAVKIEAGVFFGVFNNILMGNREMERGRWEEALVCYQRVIRSGFHLPDILTEQMHYRINYHLGLALFRLGESERSLEFLERAFEMGNRFGNQIGLCVVMGYAYERLGRYEAAIGMWERVIELGGDGVDVHFFMGNDYARMGKWDIAAEAFQRALEFDPQSVEIVYKLGQAFSAMGQKEKARACFEQVLSLDSAHTQARESIDQL